jgi:hypothetical protein
MGLVEKVRRTPQGVKLKYSSVSCDRQNACQAAFVSRGFILEMSDPDRRRAQRVAFQEFVSVVVGNGFYEVPAVTENLSSAGVLLNNVRISHTASVEAFRLASA